MKFDENARSFQSDFKKLVLPNIPGEQLSLVLRQSLPPDVLNHTLGECDDVNEMLKILEKKYGDSGKIVNVIVNEIKFAKKMIR